MILCYFIIHLSFCIFLNFIPLFNYDDSRRLNLDCQSNFAIMIYRV